MIEASLAVTGAARSIVIDESARVLAGTGVVLAARAAGFTKLRIIDTDPDTLVAVRRRGLSADQKTQLAYFDNRTTELSTWHLPQLQADLDAGVDLASFFSPSELTALFETQRSETPNAPDPDAVPGQRPTQLQRGDLVTLGRHRLLCGDSTSADDVARLLNGAAPSLMVTDPPYGVAYDPTWRHRAGVNHSKRTGVVTNDDIVDWSAVWQLFPGAVAYVWHGALHTGRVAAQLEANRFQLRAQIIWRKERLVLSRGHYHWQHEPCWYAVRRGQGAHWAGDRTQTTAWAIDQPQRCPACGAQHVALPAAAAPDAPLPCSSIWDIPSHDDSGITTHGTQKPVECMARAMRNHDAADVYEPFSGSGSSLIAAELLGRRCYAMEIDPGYVQMAVDRWETFTGKRAVIVGNGRRQKGRTRGTT